MKISKAASQAQLNALTALLNGGSLVIYSGTQPANPDTALSGDTVLATFAFASTAFSAATNAAPSAATAAFAAATVVASASGTATFARAFRADGTTAEFDCSVGLSGASPDITLTAVTIVAGGNITISSLVLNEPAN